jgi:hypothetical protein
MLIGWTRDAPVAGEASTGAGGAAGVGVGFGCPPLAAAGRANARSNEIDAAIASAGFLLMTGGKPNSGKPATEEK